MFSFAQIEFEHPVYIHYADTEEGQNICRASTYVLVYSSIIECHLGKKVLPEIGVANDLRFHRSCRDNLCIQSRECVRNLDLRVQSVL